ncbi:cilia- and flagella-associated protein 107 isoform X2 [Notamacropus eugenii]|uniref:cilia- and flagella-associated protein 107 isoform X2 n=1 Tax=Notamacropus eugenii TaxID=9315 RepID=UPI003B67A8C2
MVKDAPRRPKPIKTSKPSYQSTFQKDFVWFPDQKADHITKWYYMRRSEGLPYNQLMTHHEEPKHRNLISTYDDHFNRHGYNPALPPIRCWNGQKLVWLPEKSDFSLLAPPTNYGLFESLRKKWQDSTKTHPNHSIYTLSYIRHPVSALSRRELATPVSSLRLQ